MFILNHTFSFKLSRSNNIMDFDTAHNFELKLMTDLQAIRGPLLDKLMVLSSYFDTSPFFFLVIAITWFAYSQKCGIRLMFLVFVLSAFLNANLKEIFAQPRPCHIQSDLGLMFSKTFGFPSGAAQMSMVIFGYLALNIKKAWFWLFSICLLLYIGFSRVYLGMHFPTDVLGGWFFGAAFVLVYYYLEPPIERFLVSKSKPALIAISTLSVAILCSLSKTYASIPEIILGYGIALGLIFMRPLAPPNHTFQKIIRTAFALFGTFVIRHIIFTLTQSQDLCPENILFIRSFFYLILGLWFTIGISNFLGKVEAAKFVR
jgi:membrane-associated phospholipid phosphatase